MSEDFRIPAGLIRAATIARNRMIGSQKTINKIAKNIADL